MTQSQALLETQNYQYLIGKEFLLDGGELETVKAVVAWRESDNDWQPHVCFYNWGENNPDGKISHMNVQSFLSKFRLER